MMLRYKSKLDNAILRIFKPENDTMHWERYEAIKSQVDTFLNGNPGQYRCLSWTFFEKEMLRDYNMPKRTALVAYAMLHK